MIRAFPPLMFGCLALSVLALPKAAVGQDTLSIAQLQAAARESDPRSRQFGLLRSATELRLAVLGSEQLPAVRFNGWASYQSDITNPSLNIPGATFPDLPKDRWQAALDAEQLLYDGGIVLRRRSLERARLAESAARVDVALYGLRSEVNNAFFAAFLLQQRSVEFAALVSDLDTRLAAVRARVEAGTALARDAAEVEAERLRATLQRDEANASRRASLAILANLTNRAIDTSIVLVLPADQPEHPQTLDASAVATLRQRPEFEQSRQSRLRLEREAQLASTENSPRLSAFGQVGWGLPGLNQFRTTSDAFWQAGLKVEWQPWTWRSAGQTAEALRLEQRVLEAEEQAFARSIARAVATEIEDIKRLRAALAEDQRIVALRDTIERQARLQHDEGTITTADYVETRTDVLEARLNLQRHRVELAQARAAYLTALGLP